MKTKLITLLVILILLAANAAQAKKLMLRLNLKKGTTYEMTMATTSNIDQEMMGQKMKIDQKIDMVFSYHVLDVLPNKNYLIEYSFGKTKLSVNVNGQEMNFDSESADQTNPMNASLKGLDTYKLKLEINPKGKVERIEGVDQIAKEMAANQQLAQSMQMFTNDASFMSFVGQTFNYFPENEIDKNDKWTSSYKIPSLMNMEASMNFEVTAIEKDMISLNVNSDINMEGPVEQSGYKFDMKSTGSQTGTMTIDSADGWVRQSELTQKFDVNLKMKNPQSGEDMEIPMLVNSVTNITVNKK